MKNKSNKVQLPVVGVEQGTTVGACLYSQVGTELRLARAEKNGVNDAFALKVGVCRKQDLVCGRA